MSGPPGIRVFLSYNAADLGWARWIAEVIGESGNVAVFQELDSPPGENFPLWIDRELDRADVVMPVFSRNYFASAWCTTEWTSALNRRRMVPVQVERCEIPIILRAITRVNLVGKSRKACHKLLLHGLRGPGVPASPGTDQLARQMQGRWKRAAFLATCLGIATTGYFLPHPSGHDHHHDGGTADGDPTGDTDISFL
ncbi:toll/interleukin-1 receptor domain-containing protein [Longispora sp. NPDC051575]|uniref:toll/interleukin-1 receptor domain-containing protein n=1 Tax=Longispora sp. NPDC051575 TaxID=3154943 RepID=UPI003440DE0E